MEFTQKQVAFPALESAIGTTPFQEFANCRRQLAEGQVGELARDLPDQIQFR